MNELHVDQLNIFKEDIIVLLFLVIILQPFFFTFVFFSFIEHVCISECVIIDCWSHDFFLFNDQVLITSLF